MVLSPIDYVIIALYFIVIVAIGFIAARFAKTKEDYLVAGRRLSFPLFFGCMAALDAERYLDGLAEQGK